MLLKPSHCDNLKAGWMAETLISLQAENVALKKENAQLRSLLHAHGIVCPENAEQENPPSPTNREQLIRARLQLYRSYFKGRDDVYAHRWFNKEKKKQYSPVVKPQYRHWKPTKHRDDTFAAPDGSIYEPLTDDVIFDHLSQNTGPNESIGLYVVVNTDECYLSVIDFDGDQWQKDLIQIVYMAEEQGFSSLIERSQSGNGGHIWFFFTEAIKAKKARESNFF